MVETTVDAAHGVLIARSPGEGLYDEGRYGVWPPHAQPAATELKARALACYQEPSPEVTRVLRDDFVLRYERELPTAVACFLNDSEACIAHLGLPDRAPAGDPNDQRA